MAVLSQAADYSETVSIKRQNLAYRVIKCAETLRDTLTLAKQLSDEYTNSGVVFVNADFESPLQTTDGYVNATHVNATLMGNCIVALGDIYTAVAVTNEQMKYLDGVRR